MQNSVIPRGNRALSEWQFYDKYSRWDPETGRRETWPESVARVMATLRSLSENRLSSATYEELEEAILNREIMPSMRLMAMAGPAFERDHTVAYNCSYIPIDSLRSFQEVLFLAMAGTGVGFSVETHYIRQLNAAIKRARRYFEDPGPGAVFEHTVEDSTEGWAAALTDTIFYALNGISLTVDYSLVRPAGAPLKTKGGRASGPEPLRHMLESIKTILLAAEDRELTTIEAYDITTLIGEAIVQGGVRRTAMICLFSKDDDLMWHAKDAGQLFDETGQAIRPNRFMSNNSVVWDQAPTDAEIDQYVSIMANGFTGEPGIFARYAAEETIPQRRDRYIEPTGERILFGTNPCGEVILRPRQFCNLTQAVVRPDDTLYDIIRKVEKATILGTIQSMATYFPNLPAEWADNCREERLLGVDITGQMDNPVLVNKPETVFTIARNTAKDTNRRTAKRLEINPSAAVTCVKPSGNSSVLLDVAPGLHPRFSRYYIRRVTVGRPGPIHAIMEAAGFHLQPAPGQNPANPSKVIAEFPIKSPEGAVVGKDQSALEQLAWWRTNKMYWTEHNPSVTISYRREEVPMIAAWLKSNRGIIGGLSFLPHDDAVYDLMPYEEIDRETYDRMIADLPEVDWPAWLSLYEHEDHTTAAQELACVAGLCEIV